MTAVLHERYRPSKYSEVVGQDHMLDSLQDLIEDQSTHAFLFSGPAGCGKTTLARITARELGCADIDIREADGATHSSKDEMKALVQNVLYRPLAGGSRAVIIDEVHRISAAAFDSLLKVFEEPPSHLYWLLCTTQPEKVPKTIRSRCSSFTVKAIGNREMLEFIKGIAKEEGLDTPDDVLTVVANEAYGSFRKGLVNLAQCAGCRNRKEAHKLLLKIDDEDAVVRLCRLLVNGGGWMEAMDLLTKLEKDGEGPEGIRIVVVNYVAVALKNAKSDEDALRLLSILDNFERPYNDSERHAPLLLSVGRTLFSAAQPG